MKLEKIMKWSGILIVSLLIIMPLPAGAQSYQWMSVGSLQNWFSNIGCEIEVGRTSSADQQDGLQWPAIYEFQDCQAAKGLWIGTTNFTDASGFYPYKVVHAGPRVAGLGEFFPVQFDMISKFDPPKVFVDGVPSFQKQVQIQSIDETIAPDRMIINKVNTLIGITMTRKIMQWSVPGHDNYMIYDYEFENTGNTDSDPEIELPNKDLEGVMIFFQYRYSANAQTRYVIGNATGWGINTMQDSRGDGPVNPDQYGDPANERFRAQFAWHGYYPQKIVSYDNIGGPIWSRSASGASTYLSEKDTVGRLGAPQFMGIVTIHADVSPSDDSDDLSQPSTTGYYGSDEPNTSNNDAYNKGMMESEYQWMTRGYMNPRHAWKVEPTGDFAAQVAAPNFPPGGPGGFSIGNGYGPYTIKAGEKIHIVMAEAVDGLGRQRCIDLGKQYKAGTINALTKNQAIMTGRDSLFDAFRAAIANYESGYNLVADAIKPPKNIFIDGGGDRVSIRWETYGDDDADIAGFRIYRQTGNYVDPLVSPDLIYSAGPTERSYDDLSPVRGVAYYYFILTVGKNGRVSSRYYTQAYDPTFLKRPEGKNMSDIRVVPNPYIISPPSNPNRTLFPNEGNKLAFFNIPGQCTIQIFTEIGEQIYKIDHMDGSGDAYWTGITSSNQVVVSGIYIAVITNNTTGEKQIIKFVVIR